MSHAHYGSLLYVNIKMIAFIRFLKMNCNMGFTQFYYLRNKTKNKKKNIRKEAEKIFSVQTAASRRSRRNSDEFK